MRSPTLLLLGLAACAGSGSSGASSGDSSGGGGGVGFGGAQDIGEFRQILAAGELPGADTLDANGFFNEHYNAPPPATCGGMLCLTPGLSVGRDWLTGKHQATLQLSVNTPVDPSTYHRLPLELVVVVDHSGSMASDGRLDKVKAGLDTLIDHLQPEDRIALISFDDTVTTNAAFSTVLDRARLHQVVAQLQPGGGTNIFAGLEAGFALLSDHPDHERQNRVIFLSDGLATVGITDQQAIQTMASSNIAHGIGLTTIGVGRDFDVELMRGLAEQGAGNFYFLEDAVAASEVFTEELDYFVAPLALDVKIDATASRGWTFGEVVGSRLWASQPTAGAMSIPAVFIASRVSQGPTTGRRGGGSMIFIHLEPTGDATSKVGDFTISYRLPDSTERITQHVTLDYAGDPNDGPADPYLSGPEMAERYAMYNVYLGLRSATRSTDPSCASSVLLATKTSASTWNHTHEDPDLTADLALIDQYLANLRAHGAAMTELVDGACPQADDPYGNDGRYGRDDVAYACSAGNANAGWLVMLGAVLAVVVVPRPRRRR